MTAGINDNVNTFRYSEKNSVPFCLPEKYAGYMNVAGAKKKKKFKLDLNFVIRVLALVVMVAALVVIVDKTVGYMKDIEFNNAITEQFEISAKENELLAKRETPVYPELPEGTVMPPRAEHPSAFDPASIAQMSTTYKDFKFYIYMDMETSKIQYPVVQAENNDYYLRRNINGETNLSGTLFLDYRNDFSTLRSENENGTLNRNNIIYGHNMQNGTMFGTLKKYANLSFFNKHKLIYTYSPTEVTVWQIFSVYETTVSNYYIDTEFADDEDYVKFLEKLQADSMHETDVVLDADSDILTLSTCHTYDQENGRFVVHAVKVSSSPLV